MLQIKCLLVSGIRDGSLKTISSHYSHQSAESGGWFPDDYLSTRVNQTLSKATPIEGCDTAKVAEHIEKVEARWNIGTCALTLMFLLMAIAVCSDLRGIWAKSSGGIGLVVAILGLPLPAICGFMISTIVNDYCEVQKTIFADIDGVAKMYLNFKGDQLDKANLHTCLRVYIRYVCRCTCSVCNSYSCFVISTGYLAVCCVIVCEIGSIFHFGVRSGDHHFERADCYVKWLCALLCRQQT